MRKVKDAKDLSSNELIYFKGHAKAIYMSDGSTVEDAINNIEVGTGADLSDYVTKEELNSKQDKLVSGTNIKTINGESILGGGNITISGNQVQSDWNETDATNAAYIANKPDITVTKLGDLKINSNTSIDIAAHYGLYINSPILDLESTISITDCTFTSDSSIRFEDDNGDHLASLIFNGDGTKFLADDGTYKEISSGSSAYPLVNHGTSDTTFTLTPNTFHVWDEVTTLDLDFGIETEGVANEYIFQFTSGSEPTSLSLLDAIKWITEPNIQANKIYQISILNNLGTILEFEV